MASPRRIWDLLLFLLAICPLSCALKFDLHVGTKERCIRNFSSKDTLVGVTVTVDGQRGDGQVVNIIIRDAVGNVYGKPRDIVGEQRAYFTTLADAGFDVCFDNDYDGRSHGSHLSRHVELDVDIGADAKDWDTIKTAEKMKPVEADLKRIEEVTGEIVKELEYLREREVKLRDTNESTNERVKWFAIGTMVVLVGLGAWQVLYLRAYFRSKHLI